MDELRLCAGALLPWVIGVAAMLALFRRPASRFAPGELAWIVGVGYFVGAFLLTLWMRALSIAGVRFSALVITIPLLVIAAAIYFAGRRETAAWMHSAKSAMRALVSPPDLEGMLRLAWRLLLAWLALRFVVLALEIVWRPLYPWDAWIQWATKARVWYELGRVVPFERTEAWFSAAGAAYFDASPNYPPTVPLLQAWMCIALGRWDDSLMNWPWWQFGVALGCAVYGGLRSLEVNALGALIAAFFVSSLPLANAHVALAGYADLPMAAYYACAVLAFLRWSTTRDVRDAALIALLALACTQIKTPGIVWALTLVPGVVVALLPRLGPKLVAAGFAAALFTLAVLARSSGKLLGYRLHLDFEPAWQSLVESYFVFGNWHLLWYGAIAAALLAWRRLASRELLPLTIVVAAGLLFLFVVFGFTNAREWVADQTTVNRATLHLAPVIVVFIALAFQAFAKRWVSAAKPAHNAAA